MNNLDIYEAGRAVPPEAQKSFNNGRFSGTDINPMWRIKKLTELFGACGVGWYYDIISERAEEHGGMTIAVVDLNLYIKVDGEWSKPIYGTGGNTIVTAKGAVSDEGYKMALTDALSVACKALGIGADVYFSKDKTKYTASAVLRNRLDKITQTLAKGDTASMSQAINIWSEGKYNAIEDVPDADVPRILNMAESIYRKRGFTD